MQCKCSLNNNYEVIGLCDIDTFNKIISKFKDNSWTQVKLPSIIDIPKDKMGISNVVKTFINVKITSTKIVNTPKSNISNVEGLNLTGKILIVHGKLCQSVIYTSDNCLQSMHQFRFEDEFSTYIAIEEDADIDNEQYCVYPCIEDVFLKPLDNRKLARSISLFLFAHRIRMPINININNQFIFKNNTGDDEVVRVAFDGNNRRLIVTSTGIVYNVPSSDTSFIKFELRAANGITIKASGIVNKNEDGTNFANSLNNQNFEAGDTIYLSYPQLSPLKITLTNYPSLNQDYNPLFITESGYKITQTIIEPYILKNTIFLNSTNNLPVVKVSFDILSKRIGVGDSAEVANPAYIGQKYFEIILKNFHELEKTKASIQGNQNGGQIRAAFQSIKFEFSDIITLNYQERTKVEITNFPDENNPIYNPVVITESFKITEQGLVRHTLGPAPTKLPNAFIFNSFDTNEEVVKVEFDITNTGSKKLIATSTGRLYNSGGNFQVLNFFLLDANNKQVFSTGTVLGNANGDEFVRGLNDQIFISEDIIYVTYLNNTKLKITNYLGSGQDYNMIDKNLQSFKITNIGIEEYVLPNIITLKDVSNQAVVIVKFDIIALKILCISTGNIANSNFQGQDYFKATLLASNNVTVKGTGIIQGGQDATDFKRNFSKLYAFGDIIKLEYLENIKVEITNFPTNVVSTYNPSGNTESYRITEQGLLKL